MLRTMYDLVAVGQITVAAAEGFPAPSSSITNMAQRDSDVVPSAEVSVWELVVHVLIVARPATACSTIDVILSLTTVPHVPLSSPVTGRASLSIGVYPVVMWFPYVFDRAFMLVVGASLASVARLRCAESL